MSLAITLCGQCCRSPCCSFWSTIYVGRVVNLMILICYWPAHCCTWNVCFALYTKHNLHYNMAACTWWPSIEKWLYIIYRLTTDRLNFVVENVTRITLNMDTRWIMSIVLTQNTFIYCVIISIFLSFYNLVNCCFTEVTEVAILAKMIIVASIVLFVRLMYWDRATKSQKKTRSSKGTDLYTICISRWICVQYVNI